jgi:hypothetical protein
MVELLLGGRWKRPVSAWTAVCGRLVVVGSGEAPPVFPMAPVWD